MQVTLDIKESRFPFFMELVDSLDYIKVVQAEEEMQKQQFVENMQEAFKDVELYEQGKKQLKTAEQLLDEL